MISFFDFLTLFDFSIAEYKTYFVNAYAGCLPLLVHNYGDDDAPVHHKPNPRKSNKTNEHLQRNKQQIHGDVDGLIDKEWEILDNKVQRAGKTAQRIKQRMIEEADKTLERLGGQTNG